MMKPDALNKIVILLLAGFTGCTNISQNSASLNLGGNPALFNNWNSSAAYTHTLKTVSVTPQLTNTGATTQEQLTITVDTGLPGFHPLTEYCTLTTSPCTCEIRWNQLNSDGTPSFERTIRAALNGIQSGLVTCLLTEAQWTQIPNQTILHTRIVPSAGNSSGLNTTTLDYPKGQSTNQVGDFLDNTNAAYRDVHRYACHSKRQGAHEIFNKYVNARDNNGNDYPTLIGSCFCTGMASSATAGNANGAGAATTTPCSSLPCPAGARTGYSAQNYYRNLYIGTDLLGQINSSNSTYDCPRVLEGNKTSAKTDPGTGLTAVPQAQRGTYWPLDSTFALAVEWSSEWSVGITAGSLLTKVGDPNTPATSTACRGDKGGFIENGVFPRCLGYAKRPKTDGSCGTIQDSTGRVRPLTRLRRYRAVLPQRFDANGDLEGQGGQTAIYPAVDEVYVADRLVLDANGVPTGDMIYGPKPCNYSWFDHEGVTNRVTGGSNFGSNFNGASSGTVRAVPRYVSTAKYYKNSASNPTWNDSLSVNPDGLIFPNRDSFGSTLGYGGSIGTGIGPLVCSASLPVVNYTQGAPSYLTLSMSQFLRTDSLSIGGTKNIPLNEVHLRPIDPWVPQYLEDTSFQACAPISNTYVEPPLHFYRNAGGDIGWCAETYPNQNPYWAEINKKRRPPTGSTGYNSSLVNYPTGAKVAGYTQHNDTIGIALGINACSGTRVQQVCNMTEPGNTNCSSYLLPTKDPSSSAALGNTCDRTVMFDSNQGYRDFPLQASDTDIDSMLKNDLDHQKMFSCAYSVNSDRTKINTAYPATGCCGKRSGVTVLGSILSAVGGGHLEPLPDPMNPNILFCGNPVK